VTFEMVNRHCRHFDYHYVD